MTSIIEYLRSIGCHTVDSDYQTYIDTWVDWYRGDVQKFHHYRVFNGIKFIGATRASLGMAKTVSEDWANLLFNERVQIAVNREDGNALDALLAANNFSVRENRTIERAFATGTGAWSEYLDGAGRPRIDCHDARGIWPLEWRNGEITECAFSSVEVVSGKKALYLRLYRDEPDGTQRIENHYLDYESGKPLPLPDVIAAAIHTGIKARLFQIVTPNLNNNIDATCPMGISVFANAVDILKGVDLTYDSWCDEYRLGRKRLMIPMSMAKIVLADDGTTQPMFDPNDTVFYAYTPDDDAHDGFHDISPEIRAEQHKAGLQANLSMLSFKCGLGANRYSFDRHEGVKTATEVVSEQSDLYQSLCKHEIVLGAALRALAVAMAALSGCQISPDDVTVTFDDSVIQDKSSQRAEARDEVTAGLMSKLRYLMDVVGMSKADAQTELDRIRGEGSVSAEALDFFNARSGG